MPEPTPPCPISLSDSQLSAVMRACKGLQLRDCSAVAGATG